MVAERGNVCGAEKARLHAEAKAAEITKRKAEAEAALLEKQKREVEREEARRELQQVGMRVGGGGAEGCECIEW